VGVNGTLDPNDCNVRYWPKADAQVERSVGKAGIYTYTNVMCFELSASTDNHSFTLPGEDR